MCRLFIFSARTETFFRVKHMPRNPRRFKVQMVLIALALNGRIHWTRNRSKSFQYFPQRRFQWKMMIRNRKEEGRVYNILFHVSRKSPTHSENRLTAILNWKKLSPSRDSNPACPDRMPSLNHLCRRHFLVHWTMVLAASEESDSLEVQ